MAGRNAQERFRIFERRKRVAAMYLQGMKQWEIGRQLNVTQQCIAKDIQALEREWLASAVVAIDAAKAKELARIERKLNEDTQKAKTITSKATELRDGNPEYLKRVEWCITRRCELLKLNPPQRLEHGGSSEMPPIQTEQVELTRAQRFVRIASLLADSGTLPLGGSDGNGACETQ